MEDIRELDRERHYRMNLQSAMKDGGVIKPGFHQELDELRETSATNGKDPTSSEWRKASGNAPASRS